MPARPASPPSCEYAEGAGSFVRRQRFDEVFQRGVTLLAAARAHYCAAATPSATTGEGQQQAKAAPRSRGMRDVELVGFEEVGQRQAQLDRQPKLCLPDAGVASVVRAPAYPPH